MKRLLPLLLALLCLLSGGCAVQSVSRTSFALNTTVSVTLYGCRDEAIADGAIDLCASYEAIFSRTDPASELCRLNAGELTEVSPELASVMEEALFFAQLSGGAFDPTMGGLADLWNFSGEAPAVPDPLAAYMPQVPQAAPQPAMVMVGQPVLCDCGAMFPQVGGVIIGFVEKEATRWTPAATMAVIRWADGRQDFHKLSDIHPQGWRSQNGSGLGVFFAR